jgi:hypothetical protein
MDVNTKSIVRAFHEKMDACVASRRDFREVTMSYQEKMEPNSGKMETVVERQKIPNVEVEIHSLKACRGETAASQEATETEPDPGTMQSKEEHQEFPKEEATVMPIGGLRKRRWDRNVAAGRRQKPKGRIRASCESSRRLTLRKVFCRAAVARRKRNIFRKIGTQGNCGPRSKLTAAGIKMTSHAKMAWRRDNFVRKDCTRVNNERETQRVGPLRKNLQMYHEGKCGRKDLCGRKPLCLRKERTSTNGIKGWSAGLRSHLGSEGRLNKKL